MEKVKVLFVGETCMAHTMEFKGYDAFTATRITRRSV